jgi:P4 family phage/plasmid primase-like protien
LQLGAVIWTARPGTDTEFIRPVGWQMLTPDGNDKRLAAFESGMALCVNTGGVLVVVDVDPRNGGDTDKVRALLAELNVRVFAEITSPSGGKHFYIAGHEALPSVHGKIPGFPGVDIQSFGTNVFLPGTRRGKYGGKGYTVEFDDLDALAEGGDPAGAEAFAQWVAERRAQSAKEKAKKQRTGRSDFDFERAKLWTGGTPDARQQAYLDRVLEENAKKAAQAVPGERNEALYLAALKCSSFVAGAGMDRQLVLDVLEDAAAECGLVDDDGVESVYATIRSAFRIGLQNLHAVPDSPKPASTGASDGDCQHLEDAYIGKRIADQYLNDRFLYTGAFGWMKFDGRRWEQVEEPIVAEQIRLAVIDIYRSEGQAGAEVGRLKQLTALLSTARMKAILWVVRSCLCVEGEEFDAHPDLLNVRNGVVDLRDGTIRPHDPLLRFTKVTMVDYRPGAVHEDWQKGLTALPVEVADWLQVRWGQGLTGHPAPDDVLVVLKGSGENGKTTLVDSVREAVGPDYAVVLPDRVLLARTGDHPTELMTLRGARLAFMEEFPELGHLNVKRLKDLHGTGRISARFICKDSVSWQVTHTMFVTTNYLPRVDESDHGTWRRLLLVNFPYRYRKSHEMLQTSTDRLGDPDLRDRLRRGAGGQHEAILAWLVKGALTWYQRDKSMPEPPESVRSATSVWRMSSDLLLRYINDNLVFDPDAHVMGKELFEDFVEWLKASGHNCWTDQNFSAWFAQHPAVLAAGVEKQRGVRSSRRGLSRCPRPHNVVVPNQYAAWAGVRFRLPNEADVSVEGVA